MNEPTQAQKETLATVAKIVYPHFMYFAGDDSGVAVQHDGLNKLDFDTWQELAEHLRNKLSEWYNALFNELVIIERPELPEMVDRLRANIYLARERVLFGDRVMMNQDEHDAY